MDGLEGELAKPPASVTPWAADWPAKDELAGVVGELDDTKAQLTRLRRASGEGGGQPVTPARYSMYKLGRLGYLKVLLNSHRLSELVTRLHLLSLVVESRRSGGRLPARTG